MYHSIDFTADANDNPFRFIVVVRGTAENDGKIHLNFFGHQSTADGGETMKQVIYQKDKREYEKNNKVLLVMPSEPFSLDATSDDGVRMVTAHAHVGKRKNIIVKSAELQVWKGQGEKSSGFIYPFFFLILISLATLVIRFMKWKL